MLWLYISYFLSHFVLATLAFLKFQHLSVICYLYKINLSIRKIENKDMNKTLAGKWSTK